MTSETISIYVLSNIMNEPRAYEASPGFVRMLCGTCGTPLSIYAKGDPKLTTIRSGRLEHPNSIKPKHHIITSTLVDLYKVSDDLPRRHEGAPEVEKLRTE